MTTMAPWPCSGNGLCVPDASLNRSVCVCSPGWIGDSDFQVTTSRTDCQINVQLLQALWGIYLAIHLLVGFGLFLPKLARLRESHRQKHGRGSYFCFSRRSGIFTIAWYLMLGYPSQFAYAVIKLARPEWNLGESIALTIIYSVWRITFYVSSAMFYTSLLTSILKSQRKFASVLQRAHALSIGYTSTITLVTVVPFIPLIATVDEFDPILGMAPVAVFLNVCALAMAYFACISQYVRSHILHSDMFVALNSTQQSTHSEQQRAQMQLLLKFANLMASSRNVALSQAVLYGLFGCIPYLWNKHDYLLPFTWVPVVLVALNIIVSLQTDEDERSRQLRVEELAQKAAHREAQEQVLSTVVQSLDCESVVNVDVDSPALLATNARWKSLKLKSGGRA